MKRIREVRKSEKRIIRNTIILFCIIIAIISTIIGFYINYSYNIIDYLNHPKIENCKLDLSETNIKDYCNILLKGDWEFYYNKWIITENIKCKPTGIVEVPKRWTGKDFNGKKLPKEGYGSYRLVLKNPQEGQKFLVYLNNFGGAYRVFINKQLCVKSGIVSKNANETYSTGRITNKSFYKVHKDDEIEIVIELSANKTGGLCQIPRLSEEKNYIYYNENSAWFVNSIPYLALGILLTSLLVILFLNYYIYYKEKNFSIFMLLVAIGIHYFSSIDIFYIFPKYFKCINYCDNYIFCYITALVLILTFIYSMLRHHLINWNYKQFTGIVIINLVTLILYLILYGYVFTFYLLIVPFASMAIIIYKISKAVIEKKKFAIIYLAMFSVITVQIVFENFDNSGMFSVGIEGMSSTIVIALMLVSFFIYIMQLRDISKQAIKASELEKNIMEVKNKALRDQVKPHFIFNSLTSIQNTYHESLKKGDEALSKFSQHLRLNVTSEYKDKIKFVEELNNIQNYFELENMRFNNKLMLLYDIDYTDFEVPILSLQPLIENAIKYAKTDEKEDGFIQIQSYKIKDKIVIKIIDNGIGFDVNKVNENSTGLNNIKQRLKYSLNAEVLVKSEIGKGTTIEILIPIIGGIS